LSLIGNGLLGGAADEAHHLRAFPSPGARSMRRDPRPWVHLHEHVAREELALALALLAVAHLDDFFGRHEDLAELGLEPVRRDAIRSASRTPDARNSE
jgi:hypothetical protein